MSISLRLCLLQKTVLSPYIVRVILAIEDALVSELGEQARRGDAVLEGDRLSLTILIYVTLLQLGI